MLHHVLLPRQFRHMSVLKAKIALEEETETVREFLEGMHQSLILIMEKTPMGGNQVKFVYLKIGNEAISILLSNEVQRCKFYVSKEMEGEIEVRGEPPHPDELGEKDSDGNTSPTESDVFSL